MCKVVASSTLPSCTQHRWLVSVQYALTTTTKVDLKTTYSCIQGLVLRVSSSLASSKLYRLSRESLEGAEVSTDGAAAAPPPYAASAMFASKAAGVQLQARPTQGEGPRE